MSRSTDIRTPGVAAIAKKWNISLSKAVVLINQGAKIEKEHTKSLSKAKQVARDHIAERPDYYQKLKKMEKSPVSMKEESGVTGVRGLGYVSGDPSGVENPVDKYITTNSMSYEDLNGNILKLIRKLHGDHHEKSLGFYEYTPNDIQNNLVKEGISAGPERESDYSIGAADGGRNVGKKLDVKEGKVLDKLKKSAKVGALVGALGAHGGKIYDIGNVATHHDDPGLAAATMVANIHPASRVANAMTTALKASKANAGENEFKRQKKYGAKVTTKEEQIKEDLRKWFREKWVRYDTKGNIKGPCARDEGEGKPKCRPLASARAMSKDERAKSARRKRREDPVADRPGKGGKPINVQTEETLLEKNVPTNPALWARAKAQAKAKFDVYPSAYANGWASKWYKSKGGGWKSAANESIEEACWDTHKQVGWKKKGNKMVPDCVRKEETDAADETNMARTQLKAMASKATNLDSKLKSPKNLPGWVQSKIAVAKDGITAVDDYMTHSNNINEISAELVGKVSNARFWRGEAPSKTLTRAINKKFIESGKKKENVKKQTVKEELMDTKEQIHEAINNIVEDNLVAMKENFLAVLQEKSIEKLEERKKDIAAGYFGQ